MDDFTIKDLNNRTKPNQTSQKIQIDELSMDPQKIDDHASFDITIKDITKPAEPKKAPENIKPKGASYSSMPIILVEPNYGRLVTLEIVEQNEFVADLYKSLIDTYMEGLEQFGTKWHYEGRKFFVEHPDGEMAEMMREAFRK